MKNEKTIKLDETKTKLKLNDVKVIFASLVDEGFGTSVTIDATNPTIKNAISEWVVNNNIGKGDKAGVPNFKEYKPEDSDAVIQFTFKFNDFTRWNGVDGLTKNDLGYGATVSLIANAFLVDNKFMKGVSASLQNVLITKKGETSTSGGDTELLNDFLSAKDDPFA